MYFILFWALNLPQETDKKLCLIDSATCWSVLSSKFCNMLMCATIFPQGSGFSKSKVKEKYSGYSWYWVYTSVCVIYGAVDEEDVERYQIGLALGIKTPSGDLLIPPSSKHTHPHTNSLYSEAHTLPPFTLHFFHAHTHLYLLQIQLTQLICLKVNLPHYYLSSNPAVPNSQPLLHILKERNQISAFINSSISATNHPIFLLHTFLTRPLFVPTKTSEWFL